ncbi:MAG: FAD:protein FMN transferase [Gammaproteobacteria bacterium]|nr:FAD:protein FMN transferase [Gammaproteobacteria bacterium]
MRVVAISLLLLLVACSDHQDDVEKRQVFAVGTLVEFTLAYPPENAEEALRAAEDALLQAEHRWRAWDDGELAELNRALSSDGTAPASDELLAGIRRAQGLAGNSGNRFNPVIGKLVETWGFHQEERPDAPPPDSATLISFTEPPLDPATLEISGNTITSADPRNWIDMGAFAKGLAVDAAIEALREHGIDNAIVNAGGDLKVLGTRGDRDWRIGVRHPSGSGVLAALDIAGPLSVFTSGNYERRFAFDGESYHHILDPATGMPARGLSSVTVVHEDAALADAAATALFVAGPEDWPGVARRMGIKRAMVVQADGSIAVSRSLRDAVVAEEGTALRVVELEPFE